MEITSIYLLLISFVSLSTSLMFPLEMEDLNQSCERSGGVTGAYKLSTECKEENLEYVGYIQSAGLVVCCGKPSKERIRMRSGEKARQFCEKHGSKLPPLGQKIVGGEKAAEGDYPHMVALGYDNLGEIIFDCGGSLISEKFVVTAAHCASRKKPKMVRIGRVSKLISLFTYYSF